MTSDSPGDVFASMVTTPWRPRSLPEVRPDALPSKLRWLILGMVVFVHVVATIGLIALLDGEELQADEQVTLIDFIDAPPPAPVLPEVTLISPPPVAPIPAPVQPPPLKKRRRAMRPTDALVASPEVARPRPAIAAATPARTPGATSLQLYDDHGRVRVPDDMLASIDRKFAATRNFSYQVPHMDDAKKLFYRNPAITYESTRFAEFYRPDTDILTGVLTQLVEKTTKQIRIPVPGRPGSTMVCTISLLALGGGCGVLTNGEDYVGPLDDPDTLSEAEDKQCAAWWDQIIGAKTQEVWRKTRSLYEAQCRKPLARKPGG